MNTIRLQVKCRVCGENHIIPVNREALNKYRAGELAQRAFPELSPADRELIISQTCQTCWDKMFCGED